MSESFSPEAMSFEDYLFGTLLHPRRIFDRLLLAERRLKFGFFAMVTRIYI